MKFAYYFGPFAVLLSLGCTSKVEDRLNCGDVCNRYQDCFDDDYDVGACIDSCTSRADDDDDFSRRVDRCETCIDDRACAEATFVCATDCSGVVP
jgi:hypothetical protein